MIPAQSVIARFRRDVFLGTVLNAVLLTIVALCFFVSALLNARYGGVLMFVAVIFIWGVLGYHSIKGTRLAAGSPSLIAAGEYEQAEVQIDQALRSFSLFRASKLLSLHHLAVLRHAQRRWGESAELCRALLRQRLGPLGGLAQQSRLILADSLLELGDLRNAHLTITELYQTRLSLAEALSLLHVQLDYLWRINGWEQMLAGLGTKVQLTELMNTPSGARSQALLALAAKRAGRNELADYLRRRVELLVDVDELIKSRPVLHDLYQTTPGQSASAAPDSSLLTTAATDNQV
jgi:hypothetical protein